MSGTKRLLKTLYARAGLTALALSLASTASAGPREAALRMYNRLASTAPNKAQLDQMESLVAQNRWFEAATLAMAEPNFYNVTLKNWVTPWTNRDRAMTRPLNDMSATLIGIIRDENEGVYGFDDILSADVLYVSGISTPSYARNNNNPYTDLENARADLSDKEVLKRATQSEFVDANFQARGIAGVMSTRQWGSEYYNAGTNRRSFRYAAINFMCRDFEQMFDTSIPDEYVTRDVDRAPGGDPTVYLRRCIGCHAGANDPFRKAFAFYDFEGGATTYQVGRVPGKLNDGNRQAVFVNYDNATVTNEQWFNLITSGVNRSIGWNTPKDGASFRDGVGAASLGRTLAATDAFAKCVSRRAFDHICIRKPTSEEEKTLNGAIADGFKQTGYKVKPLFANVSALCLAQ